MDKPDAYAVLNIQNYRTKSAAACGAVFCFCHSPCIPVNSCLSLWALSFLLQALYKMTGTFTENLMHEYTPITNPYQEKLSLFLVKTIRPQKNWGAHVHSHTKSHISGTKRSDPHLVPDADVWPLPEKELFLFLGLQFLQVFSNLKW